MLDPTRKLRSRRAKDVRLTAEEADQLYAEQVLLWERRAEPLITSAEASEKITSRDLAISINAT